MADNDRAAIGAAVAAATVLIAFQTAAKATRDAVFLDNLPVTDLPLMVVAASFGSLALAYAFSWLMPVFGPAILVALTLAVSSLFLILEWFVLDVAPQAAAVILYLHYGAFGALLISGFWSIVNERFDPRTAKRHVGQIAAGATIGGLLGGVLAERVGAAGQLSAMLPALGGLHAIVAALILLTPLRRSPGRARYEREDRSVSGLRVIAGMPYLRNLTLLVLVATVGEMLIDYVFKARAEVAIGGGESLLRFFAVFYTGVALLTVVVQAFAARFSLQRLGLTQTVALMPATMGVGSLAAILVPGLASAGVARGGEIVMRNSLYRAGYELLFTPLAARDKRAAKSLVDVGVVRVGDITGGLLVQAVLAVGVASALNVLLGLALLLSLIAVYLAIALKRGYVRTLERSLVERGRELDLEEIEDVATRTAIFRTLGDVDLSSVLGATSERPVHADVTVPAAMPETTAPDRHLDQLAALRSRNADRVRRALTRRSLTVIDVPQVISLLAWDDVAADAIDALRPVASRHVGQLVDRMIDPDEEFAVRRRIPLVLSATPEQRAVDGLMRALADQRFEVRYRAGRVLSRLRDLDPSLTPDRALVTAIVLREVAVDDGVWKSRRLLDHMDDEEWSPMMDELLITRADRSLEHVFTLLSLVLPPSPLKVAFRGLHTSDKQLRGTALEYLETALPGEVKSALWPFLDDDRQDRTGSRRASEVMQELLQSHQSIVTNLQELRRHSGEVGPASEESGPS